MKYTITCVDSKFIESTKACYSKLQLSTSKSTDLQWIKENILSLPQFADVAVKVEGEGCNHILHVIAFT